MPDDRSKKSKSALELTWTNIGTIITTAVAIAISGLQHLNGNKTDGRLAPSDIIGIAVIPVIAILGIIQSYQKVQKAIPYDLGGQDQELTLINESQNTVLGIDELLVIVADTKRAANFSLSEVLFAQISITVFLILLAEYANLSGKSRFACDTIFYTLEALDYIYNMNLLQDAFDRCDTRFRPRGVHPLLQNTAGNFIAQPATTGAIDNPGLSVVDSQNPTVEMRKTRRRSILENTFDLLANASRSNAIENAPDQDGNQAIGSNDIESNHIQVLNQSSSSGSLSPRDMIQSEGNTGLSRDLGVGNSQPNLSFEHGRGSSSSSNEDSGNDESSSLNSYSSPTSSI